MGKFEQLILASLSDRTPHSLIALRSKLNVDVEHFVTAINGLEGHGLISRTVAKVCILEAGEAALSGNQPSTGYSAEREH